MPALSSSTRKALLPKGQQTDGSKEKQKGKQAVVSRTLRLPGAEDAVSKLKAAGSSARARGSRRLADSDSAFATPPPKKPKSRAASGPRSPDTHRCIIPPDGVVGMEDFTRFLVGRLNSRKSADGEALDPPVEIDELRITLCGSSVSPAVCEWEGPAHVGCTELPSAPFLFFI